MKFKKTQVMNFEGAIRGARNPLNSWAKSDSYFGLVNTEYEDPDFTIAEAWIRKYYPDLDIENEPDLYDEELTKWDSWLLNNGVFQVNDNGPVMSAVFIGPNDMKLMQALNKGGSEERKYLRQIFVSVDITAPIYYWKELDTYKIGTTANSTSTMHKLASTPITLDCFETDDMESVVIEAHNEPTFEVTSGYAFGLYIKWLEELRQKYTETKDKRYWKELIRLLPESWLQTRTWTGNYEILRNICRQRKNHKLIEWRQFISWVEELPYANELIFDKKPNENA